MTGSPLVGGPDKERKDHRGPRAEKVTGSPGCNLRHCSLHEVVRRYEEDVVLVITCDSGDDVEDQSESGRQLEPVCMQQQQCVNS